MWAKNRCHKQEWSDLVKAMTQVKELYSKTQSIQKVKNKIIFGKSNLVKHK